MFEDLRRAFREGIDNFNKELNREHVPETVDKLIKGMVDEITDAKSGLSELENQIKKALIESEKEKGEAQTARRREQMANEIGDAETAMIAASFVEKHEQHQTVLEQKALALKAEFEFREAGIEEMMSKIKEAKTKRESISATAGRTGARESISAADDLFSELDRISDKIDGEKARGDAAEAFSDIDLGGTDSDTHIDMNEAPHAEPDFDAALEGLKRRMGKE